MNKFTQKRPFAEEIPLAEVINRYPERREFKTAKMALEIQAELQRKPLIEIAPVQAVDVVPVAATPAPAAEQILIQAHHLMPAPQPASAHDQLIAYIQSKHWQFWGHLNPAQPDNSMQTWTHFPTSKDVQVLKGKAFLIRQSGPHARNAPGSKVVHWVCKFQHAQNGTDCFVPIKLCPFEKKLFSTEIRHAQEITANNLHLMPMLLVVRADLLAEHYSIREILGSYVSSKLTSALMPVIWIMKNNQIHEYTFQSAQEYLSSATSIKSQLSAKTLSPSSADKVRKREFESFRSNTPSSGNSSSPELIRAETDDESTLSKSVSLEKDLKKPKVQSQAIPPKKKSSQKAPTDHKQKSLISFFGRPSQAAPSNDALPKENAGSQPDHYSPDV